MFDNRFLFFMIWPIYNTKKIYIRFLINQDLFSEAGPERCAETNHSSSSTKITFFIVFFQLFYGDVYTPYLTIFRCQNVPNH